MKMKKTGNRVLMFLQKLGKSMMLPIACMPLCGILSGIGYLLCPASMQGGDAVGTAAVIGLFLVKAGSAILDNIPILFAICVGVGMSDDGDGVSALSALVSFLMIRGLLDPSVVSVLAGALGMTSVNTLPFEKISNPFIGIMSGLIGAFCYNRFKNTKLPKWLGFFSGKRCVAILSGLVSAGMALIQYALWPLFFQALFALGNWIADMGIWGAGIYAALNRLLIPSGLHHALNSVFWFDTAGLGDLTNFWAGKTSQDVGWSLGMYMSGFFPCMMFGTGGAALAMILCTDKKKRKRVAGLLGSSVLCCFVCGITEPFEFSFMFLCPPLFLAYALLYGIFTVITLVLGFRAGFSYSGGAVDLLFSAGLPAAQKTWLILPLGLLAFVTFFGVFFLILKKFHVALFDGDMEQAGQPLSHDAMAKALVTALGGGENLISLSYCTTRLRLELKDSSLVDESAIRAAGSPGVIHMGEKGLQVVIGTDVQFVAQAMEQVVKQLPAVCPVLLAPVSGRAVPMAQIPDPVFSQGILGDCFGIDPQESGEILSPLSGQVVQVADTGHAVCLAGDGYEILLHAGVDTVKLNGEGFTVLTQTGAQVTAGQPLLRMDVPLIRKAGYSPVVITAVTEGEKVTFTDRETITAGESMAVKAP